MPFGVLAKFGVEIAQARDERERRRCLKKVIFAHDNALATVVCNEVPEGISPKCTAAATRRIHLRCAPRLHGLIDNKNHDCGVCNRR